MISVYSYSKALEIIELFSKNQIVELQIYSDTSLGEENAKYVFDYKTYEDFPESQHQTIRECFNEKSLQRVTQTVTLLNEFLVMMETDNVILFELRFDIQSHLFSSMKSYKRPFSDVSNADIGETYKDFIKRFEEFITLAGVHKLEIPGLCEKISTGKRPKINPITFGQLICKMKDVIIDANN